MKISSGLRLIAYLMAGAVLFTATPVSTLAATSTDLQKEKDELDRQKKQAEEEKKQMQKELDSANAKTSEISSEMSEVAGEIEEVDNALVQTLAAIDMMNDEIAENEKQLEETTQRYNLAKAKEDEQYSSMKLRIKYMYEKGNVTYMQLLLESQGFSDMMNKAEYIEKLYDYDRKLLLKYVEAKEEAEEIRFQLEDEKSELEASKFELSEEEDYLNTILAEKKEEYGSYESLLADAKAEASVFKAKVANQNNAIKSLEAMSAAKQSEINDAKKREEEERRAQEEARRAAEEAARSSQDSSSSGSKPTSKGEAKSSSAGGSYGSPGSFSGSTGDRIVAYAKQFLGNPYVYGGTSLTEGCDCSGFVWRIYKDFGYSIKRLGMRNEGVEVSYEQAGPGDIVCYAGHVAIYCGGGTIVHASTERTGIRLSNINYKPWICIRRIV